MIDKYFIKSFLSISFFIGVLFGLLIGFSFFSVWFAWSFFGIILLFFVWFYRIGIKIISFAASIFTMLLILKEAFILFLEKMGPERK